MWKFEKSNAKTHLQPSSVTCGDTFSQREKAFGAAEIFKFQSL
jgi:hypothetical protein